MPIYPEAYVPKLGVESNIMPFTGITSSPPAELSLQARKSVEADCAPEFENRCMNIGDDGSARSAASTGFRFDFCVWYGT